MFKVSLSRFILFTLFVVAAIKSVYADDAEINFSGQIKAPPCEIVTRSINIDLGEVLLESLVRDGSSRAVKVKLELQKCPLATRNVTAAFHGRPFPGHELYQYANDGTARDVGIALTDNKDKWLGNGTSYTVQVDSKSREATIDLLAKIKAGKAPSSGTIKGTVQIDFSYN